MQFMVESFFTSMFNLFWGWVGLATGIALVAGLVGFFFEPLRRLAAEVVVGALAFVIIATYYFNAGDTNGADRKAAEWTRSNEREVKDGDKARSDAIVTIDRAGDDGMQHDPRNRDTWGTDEKAGPGCTVRGMDGPQLQLKP